MLKSHIDWVGLFLKRKQRAVTWRMSQKLLKLAFKALFKHSTVNLLQSFSQYSHSYTSDSVLPLHSLFYLPYTSFLPSLLKLCLHHHLILRAPFHPFPFSFLPSLQSLPSVPLLLTYLWIDSSREWETFPLTSTDHSTRVAHSSPQQPDRKDICEAAKSSPCGAESPLWPAGPVIQGVMRL